MRRVLWGLVVATICVGLLSQMAWADPGDERWGFNHAGVTSPYPLVAIDGNGNRVVAITMESGSSYTWYIRSVDRDGNENWHATYVGEQKTDGISDMAIDNQNNVIVVGYKKTNSGDRDWMVRCYSGTDGSLLWAKYYDKTNQDDSATAVAVDSNNNVIVAGWKTDSTSDIDWHIISYKGSNGSVNWQVADSRDGTNVPHFVAINSNNDIVVAGTYINGDNTDWLIKCLDHSDGHTLWTKTYGGNGHGYDEVRGLAIDSNDNIVVGGVITTTTGDEVLVMILSPDGTVLHSLFPVAGDQCAMGGLAIDSNDNVIVANAAFLSHNYLGWVIDSINITTGSYGWHKEFFAKPSLPACVAVDSLDNVIVGGFLINDSGNSDWRVACYNSSGTEQWAATFNSGGDNDFVYNLAIDPDTNNITVIGSTGSSNISVVDYEGCSATTPEPEPEPEPNPTPAPTGHVLTPQEVRTIQPAASTPDPDNGKYLGFGDVVSGGKHFKIEAQFPQYLKQSDNSTMSVKIFIAAQMPDDYSRLAYFTSSNEMKFQPPDTLSSWKPSVNGEVAKTTVFPEVDVTSALSNIPSGTHYWYTLVVPDTVPDDFAGVDWATTPWEITVNIFDVQ